MTHFKSKLLFLLLMLFQPIFAVYAQIDTSPLDKFPGPDEGLDVFVLGILNFIIGAASLVCVVMIVYSGYMYMTAGGDEQKVRTAQKTLTGSIIGLVVSLTASVLIRFVLANFLEKPI